MRQSAIIQAWLIVATLSFVAHVSLVPMAETDLFFHLRIGELIVSEGKIPFQNLFSFTYPDHADPDLAWAFQVLVAGLYRAAGFPGIVLGKTLLLLAAGGLSFAACRRAGAPALEATLAVCMTFLAAAQRLCERPHLVTFVGIAALTWLAADGERGGRRATPWLLAAMVIAWANFHAGVFFAPLLLAAHFGGLGIDEWVQGQRAWSRWPRRLALLGLLGALTFITPASWRLPSYLLWHTGLGATRNIEEFRHAEPWSDPWFFILMGIIAVATVVSGRAARPTWRTLLPLILVAVLAARSVRFVAEWAFVAAPVVATSLAAARRALGFTRERWLAGAFGACIIGGVVAARAGAETRLGLDPDVVPFAAIDFADQNHLRARMYHDLDVGCYLLWKDWPRHRVFQDARLPAYPDAFHRALDGTPLAPAAFDDLLRRYEIDAALLNEPDVNMRAGSFDRRSWALVFRDDRGLVFARRLPKYRDVIAQHEIPLAVHFAWQGGSRFEPMTVRPPESPVDDCQWQRRLGDAFEGLGQVDAAVDARMRALERGCLSLAEEAGTRYLMGARLQRAGRVADAIDHYDRVLMLAPAHVDARINRGLARVVAADWPGAWSDLERALKQAPSRRDARAGLARLRAHRPHLR